MSPTETASIENVIKLPKKSILIIRDRVSRFTENVVCVKETDGHDLRAEEEETEIENVIWDGEALLEAEVFNVNRYGGHGMMLLRNRFFKTCAFNTNLQDWFFDNDIEYVSQLAGYTTARDIKDIKLVITESSVKYLKFMPKDMPFEEKCRRFLDALYEGNGLNVPHGQMRGHRRESGSYFTMSTRTMRQAKPSFPLQPSRATSLLVRCYDPSSRG